MKRLHRAFAGSIVALLAAVLPLGATFAQDTVSREIRDTEVQLRKDTASQLLRERLLSLYYLRGVDQLWNYEYGHAADSFRKGLAYADRMPDTAPMVKEARYALATSLFQAGKANEAIPLLQSIRSVDPELRKVSYLLGVVLAASGDAAGFDKGLELLTGLAGRQGTTEAPLATRSAARLANNMAVVLHAVGKTDGAAKLMADVRKLGDKPGASSDENLRIMYATGVYTLDADPFTSVTMLELVKAASPDYRPSSGSPDLKTLLSGAYYRAALRHLAQGGVAPGRDALALLDKLEALEGKNAIDIHHAKAVAHKVDGNDAASQRELETIRTLDPAYFARINIGG
ncbi:MAG: hypothetical protein HY423_00250 [Candidatus Lambdaproteobacteria bacterium]|nr:hypothetical protein [Candidatus Lambdaproteobacteria bacterium]